MSYFWVFLGGGLGSVARYAGTQMAARWLGEAFPWGTLLVNVTGSFAIGFLGAVAGVGGRGVGAPEGVAFLMVGLCGGYTTFSAFSLQTLGLLRQGEWGKALANVLLSVALCLAAVWVGHLAGVRTAGSRTG